jgi:hypothetical protein
MDLSFLNHLYNSDPSPPKLHDALYNLCPGNVNHILSFVSWLRKFHPSLLHHMKIHVGP